MADSVKHFADECVDDSDCGDKGSCIDIMATKFPKKQCFCNPGSFGESCSRGKIKINYISNRCTCTLLSINNIKSFLFNVESSIRDASIDPTKYTIRRQLNERLVLYARIVGVSGFLASYHRMPDTQFLIAP